MSGPDVTIGPFLLSAAEIHDTADAFAFADVHRAPVRVLIQDGGVKFKIGNRTWSLPYGELEQ